MATPAFNAEMLPQGCFLVWSFFFFFLESFWNELLMLQFLHILQLVQNSRSELISLNAIRFAKTHYLKAEVCKNKNKKKKIKADMHSYWLNLPFNERTWYFRINFLPFIFFLITIENYFWEQTFANLYFKFMWTYTVCVCTCKYPNEYKSTYPVSKKFCVPFFSMYEFSRLAYKVDWH